MPITIDSMRKWAKAVGSTIYKSIHIWLRLTSKFPTHKNGFLSWKYVAFVSVTTKVYQRLKVPFRYGCDSEASVDIKVIEFCGMGKSIWGIRSYYCLQRQSLLLLFFRWDKVQQTMLHQCRLNKNHIMVWLFQTICTCKTRTPQPKSRRINHHFTLFTIIFYEPPKTLGGLLHFWTEIQRIIPDWLMFKQTFHSHPIKVDILVNFNGSFGIFFIAKDNFSVAGIRIRIILDENDTLELTNMTKHPW